jgi:hypothetical protein
VIEEPKKSEDDVHSIGKEVSASQGIRINKWKYTFSKYSFLV